MGVTEQRAGHVSSIVVYDIDMERAKAGTLSDEHSLRIVIEGSKATVAGFSFQAAFIIAGHENGAVSQYDAKVRIVHSNVRDYQVWPVANIRIHFRLASSLMNSTLTKAP